MIGASPAAQSYYGDVVDAQFLGMGLNREVKIYYDRPDLPGQAYAPYTITTRAGFFRWDADLNANGEDNPWPFNDEFKTFCIDFDQQVDSTSHFTVAAL